jgi:hypothetical protein
MSTEHFNATIYTLVEPRQRDGHYCPLIYAQSTPATFPCELTNTTAERVLQRMRPWRSENIDPADLRSIPAASFHDIFPFHEPKVADDRAYRGSRSRDRGSTSAEAAPDFIAPG